MHNVYGMVDVERKGWMKRLHAFRERLPPKPRKIAVTVLGGALLALGLAMLVLPGPGLVVAPAGLALLSTEYRWARRMFSALRRFASRFTRRKGRVRWRERGMGELAHRGFRVPH